MLAEKKVERKIAAMSEGTPAEGIDMKQIKAELLGRFATEGFGLTKREVSVMCRLSGRTVAILEALVELDIFRSKSEAIAAFLNQIIAEREEIFEEILTQAQEIATKREAAKHLAFQAVMAGRKKLKE
ncbi:MAG: hypothetical protein ACFFAY_02755 [Promethearchaeota archaeon]